MLCQSFVLAVFVETFKGQVGDVIKHKAIDRWDNDISAKQSTFANSAPAHLLIGEVCSPSVFELLGLGETAGLRET